MAGNPRRNALFGAVPETRGLQGLDGGVRSLMRTGLQVHFPGNGGNNREFFENFSSKQASRGFMAADPSEFDYDHRWLHNHPGSFLLFCKAGV